MKQRTASTAAGSMKHGGSSAGGMVSVDSLQRLKRLDIYTRPKQEFQQATTHGAVVSLFLGAAVVLLAWRELVFSMKVETVEKLFVNSTISSTMNATFNVTFSSIPCGMISLDAEDSSGIPQVGLRHDVIRTRLDMDGTPIDGGERHVMGGTLKAAIAKEKADSDSNDGGALKSENNENECNCYGAGVEGECCRTCQEIRAAYRRKGWKLKTAAIPICGSDKGVQTDPGVLVDVGMGENAAGSENEGCRLAGSLEVTKTEGNFHFVPGHRMHRNANALSFIDRVQVALENFNTTHTINSLTFGDEPPPGHASPKHVAASTVLEGHRKTVKDTHAMHQYFLKLVPTVYNFFDGTTVRSSQYSATEHLKHVHTGLLRGLPGVYFYYEVSPVQALIEEKRRGFMAFLTGACGVIGGVYTILGLVNAGIDGLLAKGTRRHRSR